MRRGLKVDDEGPFSSTVSSSDERDAWDLPPDEAPPRKRSRAAPEALLARAVRELRALEDGIEANVGAASSVLASIEASGAHTRAGYARFDRLASRLCAATPVLDVLLRADAPGAHVDADATQPVGGCADALAQIAAARVRLRAIDGRLARDASRALAKARAIEASDTFREGAYGSFEEFLACALAPMPRLSTIAASVGQGHLVLPAPPERRRRPRRADLDAAPSLDAVEPQPDAVLDTAQAPRGEEPEAPHAAPERAPAPRRSRSVPRVGAMAMLSLVAMAVGAWVGRAPPLDAFAATASASVHVAPHVDAPAPSVAALASATPSPVVERALRYAPSIAESRAETAARAAEARVGLRELARPVAHRE